MQVFSADFTMTLPLVDNVHQAIIAFMRTSERGTWQVDNAKASDAFELNFRRGNWKKALFGLSDQLVPDSPRRYANGMAVSSTRPVTCRVLLRPSVSTIKVRLEYKLHVASSEPVAPALKAGFRANWLDAEMDEIREMAAYLREVLGLNDVPAIAGPG